MCFYIVVPYDVEINGMRRYPYGSDIELTCTSEGGPQLDYSWIFSDGVIENDAMLNIVSATVSHGGNYTCNVTNDAGHDNNMTTVYSELIKLLLSEHYLESNLLTVQHNILAVDIDKLHFQIHLTRRNDECLYDQYSMFHSMLI